MGITETLRMVVTADTGQATSAFQKLGAQTETSLGKAGAGTSKLSGLVNTFGANAVPIFGAVAAGVFKMGTAFADQAVAAGKFATQTGLSVEKASALTNVANDLGVSTETLGTSFNFMLKAAGNTPKLFTELGVALVKTKDGAVDSNATFEAVIDHLKGITDPARRAAEGAQLLGRQWKEIAPLIDEGSASLRLLEESTPKNLIFHDADVKMAKDMKASFKDLGDAGQNIAMVIGKQVVPELTRFAKGLTDVVTVAAKANDKFDLLNLGKQAADWVTLRKPVEQIAGSFKQVYHYFNDDAPKKAAETLSGYQLSLTVADGALRALTADHELAQRAIDEVADRAKSAASVAGLYEKATEDANDAIKTQVKLLQDDKKAMDDLVQAANDMAGANEDLGKATDDYSAFLSTLDAQVLAVATSTDTAAVKQQRVNDIYRDGLDKSKAIAAARVAERVAQDLLNGTVTTSMTKLDLQNQSMVEQASQAKGPLRDAILGYIGDLNNIPKEVLAKIKADLDRGDVAAANADLDLVSRSRTATIKADTDTAVAEKDLAYVARDRTVKVFVNPITGGQIEVGAGGAVRGLASGGPTYTGQPVEVTEGGKSELLQENGKQFLLPGSNGQVVPLAPGGPAAVPSGDTYIFNFDGANLFGTVPRTVTEQIMRQIDRIKAGG